MAKDRASKAPIGGPRVVKDDDEEVKDAEPVEERPEISFLDVQPFKRRRQVVVTLGEGEDEEVKVTVCEFGTRDALGLTKVVQKILKDLIVAGVIKEKEDSEDKGRTEQLDGIVGVIDKSTEDVFNIIKTACFLNQDHTIKIDDEWLGDAPLGDVALLLRAIWEVNWSKGGLKKAMRGIVR